MQNISRLRRREPLCVDIKACNDKKRTRALFRDKTGKFPDVRVFVSCITFEWDIVRWRNLRFVLRANLGGVQRDFQDVYRHLTTAKLRSGGMTYRRVKNLRIAGCTMHANAFYWDAFGRRFSQAHVYDSYSPTFSTSCSTSRVLKYPASKCFNVYSSIMSRRFHAVFQCTFMVAKTSAFNILTQAVSAFPCHTSSCNS